MACTETHGTGRGRRSTTGNGRRSTRRRKTAKRRSAAPKKLSRLRKPEEMSLEQWQVALRKQFGREQKFRLRNVGEAPIFSEFEVFNPETERTYRVAIRGSGLGENYCSCPDFAVNTLGTCKHVEFTLGRLERKRGAKLALAAGFQPPFSEIYLQYGAQRVAVFRPGAECPPQLKAYARRYFDAQHRLKPEAFGRFHTFLKRAQSGEHEVRCYEDALGFIAQVRDKAALAHEVEKAFPSGVRSKALRKLLKVELYPYQRTGALFAARAERAQVASRAASCPCHPTG